MALALALGAAVEALEALWAAAGMGAGPGTRR